MADSSATLHESEQYLKPETVDRHRAIVSIMEELEAVDWYDQRVDAAADLELKELLAHNRDEEKEHAAMAIEWLRRHDPKLDEHLRNYLFTDRALLQIEADVEQAEAASRQELAPTLVASGAGESAGGSLGIGSLRDVNGEPQ